MPFFFFEKKSEIGLEGGESPELQLNFTNQPIQERGWNQEVFLDELASLDLML